MLGIWFLLQEMIPDVPSFWAASRRGLAAGLVLRAAGLGLFLPEAPDRVMTPSACRRCS